MFSWFMWTKLLDFQLKMLLQVVALEKNSAHEMYCNDLSASRKFRQDVGISGNGGFHWISLLSGHNIEVTVSAL